MSTLIKNESGRINFVVPNYYGLVFEARTINQTTGVVLQENLPVSETIETVAVLSTSTLGIALEGTNTVKFFDITGFAPHQKVDIGGTVYRIVSVTVDVIELSRPLDIDVIDSTIITLVGNTGVYYYDITVATVGDYVYIAEENFFGFAKTEIFSVIAASTDTRFQDLTNEINENENFIVNSKIGWKGMI